jgi:hypothetical protein
MTHRSIRFAVLAAAVLAGACTDSTTQPFGLDVETSTTSQGVHVFNAQLRGIIDPKIAPSPARGHVQVKLSADDQGRAAPRRRGG